MAKEVDSLPATQSRPVHNLALVVATGLLTLAFVLPNHAPPWMSFLQESLAAIALIVVAAPALLRERVSAGWRLPELLVLCLLCIASVQYMLGRIPFLQTAWMHALFLLGLLVALISGAAIERRAPLQVLWLVLTSAWMAAIVSVCLQLCQWLVLQPGEGTLWIYRGDGARPAANLGQPNSLATIIVFALVATHWLWRRHRLGGGMALVAAAYLLVGLALTQSRTGLLNASVVGISLLWWHRRRTDSHMTVPVATLALWLFALFFGYAEISGSIGVPLSSELTTSRVSVGSRPMAWRMFIEAIGQSPILGQGWGRSFLAQMQGTLRHPAQHEVFLSAHNLFLDLAIWGGLPVALAVAVALALWFRECIHRSHDEPTMNLMLILGVLFVHSMLEYPLAYAYFLLPAGLVAGALNQRVGLRVVGRATTWAGPALLAVAALAFAVTVRDYLRVEQSYRDLLLEKARIISKVPGTPPEVLVLTSLRDLILLSRLVPHPGMSDAELGWMRDVVSTHPGPVGFETLAAALSMNRQPAEAQEWVNRLCSIFTKPQCAAMSEVWMLRTQAHPELRTVRWPSVAN
jgi:hypothetical protein